MDKRVRAGDMREDQFTAMLEARSAELPSSLFLGLAIALTGIESSLDAAARGVAYYERALARVENRWVGGGHQGERFRNPSHLYADDLDVFGRGSLFELLSTSRTAAGERFLAGWLLAAIIIAVYWPERNIKYSLREKRESRSAYWFVSPLLDRRSYSMKPSPSRSP